MKTTTITLAIHSPSYNARNVERLCGRYTQETDTQQIATYSIEDGVATITSLVPVYRTTINLPMPLTVPVTDCGSGELTRLVLDADTLQCQPAICPSLTWVRDRDTRPVLTGQQLLWAEYNALH